MQKPQESLDDFLNSIDPQPTTPPMKVSLWPTGQVEVLSPLPLDQAPRKTANGLLLQHGGPRISWFHRSLIFGGGATAVAAIIFLSAVFIAVSEPSDQASVVGIDTPSYESDASIDESRRSEDIAPADEITTTTDVLAPEIASKVMGELRSLRRPPVRSRRIAVRVQRAAHIPRRTLRPAQSPNFVPTTLIIYPENGEIKTRIEPTLSAVYKIPVSFSN